MNEIRSKKLRIAIIVSISALAVVAALLVIAYMNMKERPTLDDSSTITTPVQPDGTKLVTIEGELLCLPPKDPELPHTLECALGLRATEGQYYSLKDDTPNYSLLSKAATGEKVKASGSLKEEPSDKYQSNGILTLKSLETIQ